MRRNGSAKRCRRRITTKTSFFFADLAAGHCASCFQRVPFVSSSSSPCTGPFRFLTKSGRSSVRRKIVVRQAQRSEIRVVEQLFHPSWQVFLCYLQHRFSKSPGVVPLVYARRNCVPVMEINAFFPSPFFEGTFGDDNSFFLQVQWCQSSEHPRRDLEDASLILPSPKRESLVPTLA